MKNKKWVLLLIIAFPSLFWLILETSTINSKKLPHHGPKTARGQGDTVYHRVNDAFILPGHEQQNQRLSQDDFPLYAIVFISDKYRADAYRLTGMWEYLNYKYSKIAHIPLVLVSAQNEPQVFASLKPLGTFKNVHFRQLHPDTFKLRVSEYFLQKPYYIDYSFFMLIDSERSIRGFYDARYVSEMKRLIEEYQHLRLKEEKQKLIKANEIRTN